MEFTHLIVESVFGLFFLVIGYVYTTDRKEWRNNIHEILSRIVSLEDRANQNQEKISLLDQREDMIEARNNEKFSEIGMRMDSMDKKLDKIIESLGRKADQ